MRYKAKPVYYHPSLQLACRDKKSKDAIFFASSFEYRVYRALVDLVGFNNVNVQVPLLIKPATLNYPTLYWKCDFRVYKPSNGREYLNIEAKGLALPEFKRNLQYLEYFSSEEYRRLIVVGNETKKVNEQVTIWQWEKAISYLKQIGYS